MTQLARSVSLVVVLVSLASVGMASAEDRVLGAWSVRERTDKLTDKKTCTAWHTSTPDVWMTDDALFIVPRRGIAGYRYRVGDGPVRTELPTPRERQIGGMWVSGTYLEQAIEAGRLRVEILTALRDLYEADIDLRNGNEVLRAVRECSR
jgi:hypothetical protein